MSTNCNQLQNSPKEEQTETPKIEIASLNREIQSEFRENRGASDRGEEEDGTKIDGGEESIEAKVSSRESENCVPEEENDGFRTPTSADHKITPITECPPAPRKARAQCSLKRRTPPQSSRRLLLFVAAAEAESILTPMSGENAEEQGLKRARTATGDEFMNWEGLRDDDDDLFFESRDRISSAVSLDLASCAGSDGDDFEDSRLSFASTISSASSVDSNPGTDGRANPSSILASYDMWMSEPGDIKERRKRLLQGMGLASSKDMLRVASTKIARTISRNREKDRVSPVKADLPRPPPPKAVESASKGVKVDLSQEKVIKNNQPSSAPSHSHPSPIVLGRSRSDSDIDPFSNRARDRSSCLHSNASHSAEQDGSIDSFFLIKNLDNGKEFIVKEYNDRGLWNKLSDVQTGKQITMEEFEKSVGESRLVKELMRRQNNGDGHDSRKFNHNKLFTKSFRNSKRRGAAFLKNIKVAASSKSLSLKDHEHPPAEEQSCNKTPSQWVKARQHGKKFSSECRRR